MVLSWRQGRLEAKLIGGVPGRDTSYLEPDGEDRFRSVEGRERGELLRVVRDYGGRGGEALLRDVPADAKPSTF